MNFINFGFCCIHLQIYWDYDYKKSYTRKAFLPSFMFVQVALFLNNLC